MPGLYRTPDEKRALEARNGAIQFLAVLDYVENWDRNGCKLEPGVLEELQRLAVNQVYSCAGSFRTGPVFISGVKHQPPDHGRVIPLVQEMCDYVNTNWAKSTALHLAAYVMWRVNWIHPFFGGNGRTSRATSYLVLCARLGFKLPGTPTIPDSIAAKREPYFIALQDADLAWEQGRLDLAKMETLLENLLAIQLVSIHTQAKSGTP